MKYSQRESELTVVHTLCTAGSCPVWLQPSKSTVVAKWLPWSCWICCVLFKVCDTSPIQISPYGLSIWIRNILITFLSTLSPATSEPNFAFLPDSLIHCHHNVLSRCMHTDSPSLTFHVFAHFYHTLSPSSFYTHHFSMHLSIWYNIEFEALLATFTTHTSPDFLLSLMQWSTLCISHHPLCSVCPFCYFLFLKCTKMRDRKWLKIGEESKWEETFNGYCEKLWEVVESEDRATEMRRCAFPDLFCFCCREKEQRTK